MTITPAQLGRRAAALRLQRERRHVERALRLAQTPTQVLNITLASLANDSPLVAAIKAELRHRRRLGDR